MVATLLGEFLLEVVGGLVLVLLGEVLVLLGDLVREELCLLLGDLGDGRLVLLLAGVGVDGVGDVLGVGGALLLGLVGLVLGVGLGLVLLSEVLSGMSSWNSLSGAGWSTAARRSSSGRATSAALAAPSANMSRPM